MTTPSHFSPDHPVPTSQRIFGFGDLFSLWFSLGIGLMVLQVGAMLAPGMGLASAVLAIALGTGVGVLLLGAAGVIGSDTGLSAMGTLRLSLGSHGARLPAVLNLLQLVGWGAFEIIVMRDAASLLGARTFGEGSAWNSPMLWTLCFGALATLLAVSGPLAFVRKVLRTWGIWVLLGACLWLTWNLFAKADLADLWQRAGDGSMSLAVGFDIVIAMPLSWLPLIADYSRFARSGKRVFGGTVLGYFIGNTWLMSLGVAYTLAFAPSGEANALLLALAGAGLGIPLLLILLDESEKAFADIHSAAVSTGVLVRLKVEHLALAIGVLCTLIALFAPLAQYENFLLLIGSVFAPLFGVVLMDHYVIRHRRLPSQVDGLHWQALLAWAVGVAAYHLIAAQAPDLGATLPALVLAGVLHALLSFSRGRETARA
ncbi:putative hydroxymethylpyrimidine transporter CytX [Pseudomonas kermanshahensis]|jgi:probable hydroxymethylpyrimidine transporter CytX|uniref:Hydroxymethylpyrimidine transporter CytX n=1 Tax=Pseudomonas kermanshahensis TaxID=2745482 RepID=A0ABU8R4L0_9PSED|nr:MULTISPECIES: putative hydroxymethylpyrimidine transporter CytX [Pseudomonas]ATP52371.1 putative hydroxymethylpyrimidine transporter CytX [Pseudomonas putida]MBC3485001.1 putative hydroxymethylpyrimidine transporter CytX [Pseudomonas sp. SWRI50]MCX2689077.1 putative hydroxymethylpyrimidine transporter CytX [Pseudomonas sp. DCB_AW]MDE4535861.1 putative hydroxymethylpyrimidine transporter CytX [Pseudomonas sp. ITEM 17296]USS55591.1 putative hydroxymethylpyrimidine transporter CytX [Pseudomona